VGMARSGQDAVVEVADRGPGMTDEQGAQVFERFYRGDPPGARSSGGTGLGLSIASAIAQAHGGRIEVTSTPGEGSTFRVTLPLATTPAPMPPRPDASDTLDPDPERA